VKRVDYRQSGVDIDAGNEAVRRIKALAKGTYTPGVLSGVGSFGGLFALDREVADPVLVASADGVGTKLKVAFLAGIHNTIGIDLVNHCVNDIRAGGQAPFLSRLPGNRAAGAGHR
jgi:phosphoribosylformylglycinamidine cyclo-ligase